MPSSTFCSSSTNRTRSLAGLVALTGFAWCFPDQSGGFPIDLPPLTTATNDRSGQVAPIVLVQFQILQPPNFHRVPCEPIDLQRARLWSSRNRCRPVDSVCDAARRLQQYGSEIPTSPVNRRRLRRDVYRLASSCLRLNSIRFYSRRRLGPRRATCLSKTTHRREEREAARGSQSLVPRWRSSNCVTKELPWHLSHHFETVRVLTPAR